MHQYLIKPMSIRERNKSSFGIDDLRYVSNIRKTKIGFEPNINQAKILILNKN